MSKTILIIDDDDDIRTIVQMSLEMGGGWEVVAAGSGAEGIELARSAGPDAILLDVMMPDMDGPATFTRLQEDAATAAIPVIFLTAKVLAAELDSYRELGVTQFIAKPFSAMTLADEVAERMGW